MIYNRTQKSKNSLGRTQLEYNLNGKTSEEAIVSTVNAYEELGYTPAPNLESVSSKEYFQKQFKNEETPSVVKAQKEGDAVTAFLDGDTLTVLPSNDGEVTRIDEEFRRRI